MYPLSWSPLLQLSASLNSCRASQRPLFLHRDPSKSFIPSGGLTAMCSGPEKDAFASYALCVLLLPSHDEY